LFFIHLVH